MLGLGLGVHMGNLAALREVAFVVQIKTDNVGTSGTNQFTIPTTGTGYNYSIKTSDGQTINGLTGAYTITFPSAGTYTIKVYGVFPKVYFNNGGDRLKVLKVLNWGVYGVGVTDRNGTFYGCENLTQIGSDVANWNLASISVNAFRDSNLTTLPLNFTLGSLLNGQAMFLNAKLTSLPSGMVLGNLTNGFAMFLTNQLTSLPSGMTLSNLINGGSMFQNNLLMDLPPLIKLAKLTSGINMFEGNTLNTTRYSQLLIDMEANNPNNNVPFHGGNSKYTTLGQGSRTDLVNRGWSITDGGLETGELNSFELEVKTDNAGTSGTNQFTIPTTGTGYNYSIKTSDGQTITGLTSSYTITFPSTGTYTVKVYGVFPKVYFNNTGDKLKVLKVTNWGVYGVGVTDRSNTFYGCTNLTQIGSDVANWNLVTNGSSSFRFCKLTSLPSNLTLASLTNGSIMFFNNMLTSLPSSLDFSNLTNGSFMFELNQIATLPSNMTLPNLVIANNMFRTNNLTDLPTLMKLPKITSASNMFEFSTINTTRYSQLLIDMNANNPNNNVPFHGGNSKYNAAGQVARNALIARGWVITDSGLE